MAARLKKGCRKLSRHLLIISRRKRRVLWEIYTLSVQMSIGKARFMAAVMLEMSFLLFWSRRPRPRQKNTKPYGKVTNLSLSLSLSLSLFLGLMGDQCLRKTVRFSRLSLPFSASNVHKTSAAHTVILLRLYEALIENGELARLRVQGERRRAFLPSLILLLPQVVSTPLCSLFLGHLSL